MLSITFDDLRKQLSLMSALNAVISYDTSDAVQ